MMLGKEFVYELTTNPLFVGDLVEFGTGAGASAEWLNLNLKGSKKMFTFDGFQGLPKTQKVIPQNTGWEEGKIFHDEQTTRNLLKKYPNIAVYKTMMADLLPPAKYGVREIAGANIDVDLYEGTVDALKFIDQCVWSHLLLRFDDWGAYHFQRIEEVAQHEQAAFFEYVLEKKYQYQFYNQYNINADFAQVIVSISR